MYKRIRERFFKTPIFYFYVFTFLHFIFKQNVKQNVTLSINDLNPIFTFLRLLKKYIYIYKYNHCVARRMPKKNFFFVFVKTKRKNVKNAKNLPQTVDTQ